MSNLTGLLEKFAGGKRMHTLGRRARGSRLALDRRSPRGQLAVPGLGIVSSGFFGTQRRGAELCGAWPE